MITCYINDCPNNDYENNRCKEENIEISNVGCAAYEKYKIEQEAKKEGITLKNCPFCGGTAELEYGFLGGAFVGCRKCGMTMNTFNDVKAAAEQWNHRETSDQEEMK